MILSLSDRPDQDLFNTMRITAVSFVRLLSLLGPAAAINAKRIDEGGVEGEPCAGGWSWVGWLGQQQGGMLTRWR